MKRQPFGTGMLQCNKIARGWLAQHSGFNSPHYWVQTLGLPKAGTECGSGQGVPARSSRSRGLEGAWGICFYIDARRLRIVPRLPSGSALNGGPATVHDRPNCQEFSLVQRISTLAPPAPLARLPVPARVASPCGPPPPANRECRRVGSCGWRVLLLTRQGGAVDLFQRQLLFPALFAPLLVCFCQRDWTECGLPHEALGRLFQIVKPLFEACTEGTLQHRRERANR